MQPHLDLEVIADDFCFLSKERHFNIWLKYRLHAEEAIKVDTTESVFDPASVFTKGRIEIVDTMTGDCIDLTTNSSTNEDLRSKHDSLTLQPECGSYFLWSTDPENKWHKYPLDISVLRTDTKYAIRYHSHGLTDWWPVEKVPDSKSGIECEPILGNMLNAMPPTFIVRDSLPPKPPITCAISTSASNCSLVGKPPFTISVEWQLDGNRAIRALKTMSSHNINIGIEIRDPEKQDRRIGPSPDRYEGDESESAPIDKMLLHLKEKEAIRQSYTLCVRPKADGLLHSDTWNLKSGKLYNLTLRPFKWRWLYEDEIDASTLGDEDRLRARLSEEPWVEWKPDCRAPILID